MFFVLSKILSFLIHPFSWALILLIWAWFSKRPRTTRVTFYSGIGILLFFSNTAIFCEFARLWEPEGEKIEKVGYYDVAVVLGGMAEYDNTNERLSLRRGGDRIWQTILLYHTGKVKKILISGDNGYISDKGLHESVQMKEVLIQEGIPAEDILIDSISRNTYENAIESKKVIDSYQPFATVLLVTSALHMKRAEACFENAGFMKFETFATDFYTGKERGYSWDQLLVPNVSVLNDWERLIHEWVGYVAYSMMGYI